MKIATIIKIARSRAGYSALALAEKLGRSKMWFTRVEGDSSQYRRHLDNVLDYLNVQHVQFLPSGRLVFMSVGINDVPDGVHQLQEVSADQLLEFENYEKIIKYDSQYVAPLVKKLGFSVAVNWSYEIKDGDILVLVGVEKIKLMKVFSPSQRFTITVENTDTNKNIITNIISQSNDDIDFKHKKNKISITAGFSTIQYIEHALQKN